MANIVNDLRSRLGQRLGSTLVVIATHAYLARALGASEYGMLSYIIAIASLFSPLAKFGVGGRLLHLLVESPSDGKKLLEAALTWRLVGAVIASLIALVAMRFAPMSAPVASVLLLCLLQSFAVYSILEFRFDSDLASSRLWWPRVSILLGFAALKIGYVTGDPSIEVLVTLFGLEVFVNSIATLLVYRTAYGYIPAPRLDGSAIRVLAPGTLWLVLSGLMELIYLKIDTVMLQSYHGSTQVGVYSAAARISEAVFILPPLLLSSLFPHLSKLHAGPMKADARLVSLGTGLFLFGVLCSLGFCLIVAPFLPIVFGAEYQQSRDILMIHCWCIPFIFLRALLSKLLILRDLLRFSLATTFIGAVCNIALNLLFIPSYGGYGAALATVLSYAAAGWLSLYLFTETRVIAQLMTEAIIRGFSRRGIIVAAAFFNRTFSRY